MVSEFTLTYAWESVPQTAQRLGLVELEALSSWIVEQVNLGRAESAEIQQHGWFVPVFRRKLVQPKLF